MVKTIEIKTPAKINLSLKVYPKREDGFHPLKSVMQAINLYDYLTIKLDEAPNNAISLEGSSNKIPYDENNIIYKAAKLFLDEACIKNADLNIYIEKNIPICAGLAGGSTNAAGTLYGLNKLYNNRFSQNELHAMCAKLGSDLNFCLEGGCKLATGRGEILHDAEYKEFPVTLIKPKNLSISAKEAYEKFDRLNEEELKNNDMPNDLEFALAPYYKELRYLHELGFQMSGSGPTFFAKKSHAETVLNEDFEIFENLCSISFGVCEK